MNLKPCPFCGEVSGLKVMPNGRQIYVRCTNCKTDGPKVENTGTSFEPKSHAAHLWNERYGNGNN